jgi:hypothetical protein
VKTKKNQKRKRIAILKETIRQNNLMNRFIYEIEREEPLEKDVLSTMFAYQVQVVK